MKTKLVSLLTVLLGLSFNVASAEALNVNGSGGVKYTSDYHRRGVVVSAEAVQAQVGVNTAWNQFDLFADVFTNRPTASEDPTNDEITVGVGTVLLEDKLTVYLGLYNTDNSAAGDNLEGFASVGFNTLLSPSVKIYKDTDESLYTFEGVVSHEIELNAVDLELAAVIGNTELTSSVDSTYYGAKATASKSLNNGVDIYSDIAISDTDTRDQETVWGIGLNFKF